MPVSRIPKSTMLEVWTFPNAVILSDINLDTHELVPFPAIPYKGSLDAAFMDIIIPNIRNTNAGANHMNGFTLQIKYDGSWYDCVVVPDPSLWLDGSQVSMGNVFFCGTSDIKAYVPSDTVIYPRIENHSTDNNAYYLYGVSCRLRLYFGVNI